MTLRERISELVVSIAADIKTLFATVNAKPNLGETEADAYRGDRGTLAYDHSQSAHAPVDAQKNSDILKTEIEEKLTGEIETHTHRLIIGDGTSALVNINSGERINFVSGANMQVSYDDTANSVVFATTSEISGNASSATRLVAPKKINGVDFDGTQDITINAVDATPRVPSSEKGVANGVATLDVNGKLVASQIPDGIDEVFEYSNASLFPASGYIGKLYVSINDGEIYIWNGSSYVLTGSNFVLTKSGIESVLTGTITSHDHGVDVATQEEINILYDYVDGKFTKTSIESVLTGEITTHTHQVQASEAQESGYEQHFLLMGA